MSDPMAEIKASFFLECEELLEQLQDGLKRFEEGDDDTETINEVFRAVHSIKGGAGAFGLTALVSFAHIFETSMDIVRSGEKTPTSDDYKTFLHASDILCDLVVASRDETEVSKARVDESVVTLQAFLGERNKSEQEVDPLDFQPMGVSMDLSPIGNLGNISPSTRVSSAPSLLDLTSFPDAAADDNLDKVSPSSQNEGRHPHIPRRPFSQGRCKDHG